MKFRLLLLAGLLVPALIACEKKPTPEPTPEVITATITANDVTVEEGKSASIGAATNSSNPILYTSANEAVATVTAAGQVTGVKAGNTTITLKVEAVPDKFTAAEKVIAVTVTAAPAPEVITTTITANDVTMEEGKSAAIGATTNSSNPILYTSADEAVASVTAEGLVTGLKAGNTTITLKVEAVPDKYTAAEKVIAVTVTAALPPEIKNGDVVVATNANVEKFLTDIHYPTHDYTYTSLLTWAAENDVQVCPGKSDKPAEYSIRWADASATNVTVTVAEPDRDWVYTPTTPEDHYVTITNLLPNTHYTYKAVSGGTVLTEGEFDTVGKVHQVYFKNVRNSRDLGGWKTEDGKTIKYRMVYRGGRFDGLAKSGKTAIKVEGLKAELDLRGHSDVDSDSSLKGIVDDYVFCAPVIEEGYSQMLQQDKEKTRQCMQFIFDMVDQNKPVYFHCSLGRDRTGTVAMLTLGILGVPEGDISQEYELTQFAPHGYATSDGEKTKMTRIADYDGAANVIWGYAGEGSFQDGVNAYLLEIGISQEDIDKFKANMLQ